LRRAEYNVQYWYLKAWEQRAALEQDHLVCVCSLKEFQQRHEPMWKPEHNGLSPRPMRNLPIPLGVPTYAWAKTQVDKTPIKSLVLKQYPCLVYKCYNKQSMYNPNGTMPDTMGVWLDCEKGVRRAQAEELSKVKGISSSWKPQANKLQLQWKWAISNSTCSHLWTVVLDTISDLLHLCRTTVTEETCEVPPREESKVSTTEPESRDKWSWGEPDLSKGSLWYWGRIRSLKKAIQTAGLTNESHWISKGNNALAQHHTNRGRST
jgi:hypothetical protein